MRLLLDVDALAPPLTGVGHYVRRLADGLVEARADLGFIMGGRLAAGSELPMPPALHPMKRMAMRVPGVVALRNVVRAMQMRQSQPALPADVFHEPNHILRSVPPARVVLTIHDLSILHHPEFHPPARVKAMAGLLAKSAARADMIITVSEFTKQDVMATLGMEARKIRAIPLGVGAEFRRLPPTAIAQGLAPYRLQHGGYVLALGTREPRKNLARLIDAYLGLAPATRRDRPLVLVGPKGWRAESLERRIRALQASGIVHVLGYVPDADRPALYAGSAGFAYPSIFEGFGLPPLEAAACGVPVLTSRGSPMAEVLEGVAVLVDPLDAGSIRVGLEQLLDDRSLTEVAQNAAQAIAARYTWAAMVESTIEVYNEVAR